MKNTILGTIKETANFFLIQDCLLCGQDSENDLLCLTCEKNLPILDTAYCPVCAAHSPNNKVCGRCLSKPPYYDSIKALYQYEFPVDRLIHAYKYGHRLALADYFGKKLALCACNIKADLIIPMPLHPLRLKERGFNQAHELAKIISKTCHIPIDTLSFQRVKHTKAQVDLNWKERGKNVHQAFECSQLFEGKRILIIDDVITSGATINECAKVMKEQKAQEVRALVIARAQHPQNTPHT